MDQKHRDLITKNFSSLVDQTRLEFLVSALYEKNVFSDKMIEPYMVNIFEYPYLDTSKVARDRKCKLYLDIQRRGPQAFDKLIEALQETGHFGLIHLLSPEHELSTFISLKTKPKRTFPTIPKPLGESSTPNNSAPLATPIENISDKPLQIDVKKSTTFGVSSNPEILCYSMKSKKRGILFMINNIEFKDDVEEFRKGALVDQDNLENLFTQIGFHEKIIHNNKSKTEMNDLLNEFAVSSILKNTDCVFIVIASHGMLRGDNETIVRTSDGDNIPTNSILDKFNSKNCPLLHNIPKIFIFQLCRGESPDFGWKHEPNIPRPDPFVNRTRMDGKSENVKMRTYSDMLIAHSTVPGFSSHRDIIQGSWYMISLCKIFMEHAHHSHLEDLFRLVDSHLKDIPLKLGSMQTSSVENRGFNKHCYLNPGLFEAT